MRNNSYLELKERHQKEYSSFPMMFAFSQKQFDEGMKNLGLDPEDTDKIYSLGGGGYYRRTDVEALHKMFKAHEDEMNQAIENDKTGEGFIFDMFNYELGNHEYCYTRDIEQTLDALAYTIDDINNNPLLLHGLKKACKYQTDHDY